MWFVNIDKATPRRARPNRSRPRPTSEARLTTNPARRTYDSRAWRRLMAQAKERDGGRCRDPHHPTHLDPTADLTLGHVVHEVDGGLAALENVFIQCRSCNAREAATRKARRPAGAVQAGGIFTSPTPGQGIGGQKQTATSAPIPHSAPKMPAFVSAIPADGPPVQTDNG